MTGCERGARRGPRRALMIAAAVTTVAGLAAGCGSEVDGAARSEEGAEHTVTPAPGAATGGPGESPSARRSLASASSRPAGGTPEPAAPTGSRGTTSSPARAGGAGADGGHCGVDSASPAIDGALATLRSNQPSPTGWTYIGEGNYDPCAELSYAVAETPGATASSPMQLMLFHDGAYVGTGTWCALPFMTVTGATGDAVHVEYRWPRGGDSNADPTGHATTTYRWAGDHVRMTRPLPDDMPNLHC